MFELQVPEGSGLSLLVGRESNLQTCVGPDGEQDLLSGNVDLHVMA